MAAWKTGGDASRRSLSDRALGSRLPVRGVELSLKRRAAEACGWEDAGGSVVGSVCSPQPGPVLRPPGWSRRFQSEPSPLQYPPEGRGRGGRAGRVGVGGTAERAAAASGDAQAPGPGLAVERAGQALPPAEGRTGRVTAVFFHPRAIPPWPRF